MQERLPLTKNRRGPKNRGGKMACIDIFAPIFLPVPGQAGAASEGGQDEAKPDSVQSRLIALNCA
jgi:hypothetical protein